jgi:hypothetical protein
MFTCAFPRICCAGAQETVRLPGRGHLSRHCFGRRIRDCLRFVAHNWDAIFSRARILFAIERIEDAPAAVRRGRRPGLLRLLLAPEPLARDPERPARARRGWVRLLLAVEPLGRAAPPPGRVRRGRWLRALFHVESLDPP